MSKHRWVGWALATPAILLISLGVVAPIILLIIGLFIVPVPGPTPGLAAGLARFVDGPGMRTLGNTVRIAAFTGLVTLIAGYTVAYYLYISAGHRVRRTLVVSSIVAPLLVSVVVRSYAWILILVPRTGALSDVPVVRNLNILWTDLAVMIGLSHILLPFMVLAIYSSLSQIPANVSPAAENLGAGRWHIMRTIVVPLSVPGVVAGLTLVFVLSLTAASIPILLGGIGAKTMGYLIYQQYLQFTDFIYGGVASAILLVVALGFALVLRRSVKPLSR